LQAPDTAASVKTRLVSAAMEMVSEVSRQNHLKNDLRI